jgi:hypothetical protein
VSRGPPPPESRRLKTAAGDTDFTEDTDFLGIAARPPFTPRVSLNLRPAFGQDFPIGDIRGIREIRVFPTAEARIKEIQSLPASAATFNTRRA